MTFQLAIDIGNTWTTAAIARGDRVEPAVLAPGQVRIPSVVFADADGSVVVGDEAVQAALVDPSRAASAIMRRLGDPTPLVFGADSVPPVRLVAAIVRAVVDRVQAAEGAPAGSVALACPASWGEYRRAVLGEVALLAGVDGASTRTAADCAALDYFASESPAEGDVVAVYDLGGETFEVAAVVWTGRDVEPLGRTVSIDFGGADIDEVVVSCVMSAVGGMLDQSDPADPDAIAAMDGLRRSCRAAKEALSSDEDAQVPVILPGARTRVRVTRAELESGIRAAVITTVVALRQVIEGGQGRVRAVLLVGGASRTPLVADLVTELGLPVHLWEPTLAVARGLARSSMVGASRPRATANASARSTVYAASLRPPAPPTGVAPAPAPRPSTQALPPLTPTTATIPAVPPPPAPAPPAGAPKPLLAVLALALVLALVLVVVGYPLVALALVAIALVVAWRLWAARSRGR